jgi:hypothetical protein
MIFFIAKTFLIEISKCSLKSLTNAERGCIAANQEEEITDGVCNVKTVNTI